MKPRYHLQFNSVKKIPVIKIEGRLDAITSLKAEKEVLEILTSHILPTLIIDLADLYYISSAGLKVILSMAKWMKEHSAELIFCNIHPNVMGVLSLSGFDNFLNIKKNEREALEELNSTMS